MNWRASRAIPAYNEDARAEGRPADVTALQGRIAAADAVIVATPEYNYSVPGVLKNALDWLSKSEPQPFLDKPVGIIGASPGAIGTARAQYDLRKMFVYLDAHVLNKPEVMIGAAHTRFDSSGRLTDDATRDFLKAMVVALRDWTLRLPPELKRAISYARRDWRSVLHSIRRWIGKDTHSFVGGQLTTGASAVVLTRPGAFLVPAAAGGQGAAQTSRA